jgi:hypothetical protein
MLSCFTELYSYGSLQFLDQVSFKNPVDLAMISASKCSLLDTLLDITQNPVCSLSLWMLLSGIIQASVYGFIEHIYSTRLELERVL